MQDGQINQLRCGFTDNKNNLHNFSQKVDFPLMDSRWQPELGRL